ncbi:serine beta-lactamase-like protein LACTB, mitochondrial isoform X1 [Hemibagrus wyckioides]|uniref:serine beta-lactamase-like protein LACTB, mitochondrial isoform X1 n=1 Tax=Hemibagrus wyckioides TaxID=337641 RepID=UPI00266BA7F7|nr:serine beta-lactamase-like protein LACTB, mitochondrial isoform X1 [Hemibagrus wyckioides]
MSRVVICSRCIYRLQNSGSLSCWSAARGKLEPQLFFGRLTQQRTFTQTRRIFHSNNGGKRHFWALGIGTGFLLGLGLKYHFYSRERCECEKSVKSHSSYKYSAAIETSRDLLQRIKVQDEVGAPGLVIGVSVDGTQVWGDGIGFADLENRVPCDVGTVMRIASISKSLTATAVARVWEDGRLDLDAPVQKYVPEFPEKQFEGKDVTITPRLLLSHLSGIRHYEKDPKKVRDEKEKAKRLLKPPEKKDEEKSPGESEEKSTQQNNKGKSKDAKHGKKKKEFEQEEYYLKDSFDSVVQALHLFKDDPLIFEPGTTFLYSTHAFTLLSAVLERAAGQRFLDLMMNMFRELGMLNTVPDENDPIIYNRSRYYHWNKKGRVVNCPYVDNSYKWAGGGFLSTVGDLLLFGNAMLYSYQLADMTDTSGLLPGFLKPHTVKALWAPVDKTEASWDKDGRYAQGWAVVEKQQKYGECRMRRHYISHTGGAVGASSVLLVLPSESLKASGQRAAPPQGVVVAIMANIQAVGLNKTALKIAHEFEKARGS